VSKEFGKEAVVVYHHSLMEEVRKTTKDLRVASYPDDVQIRPLINTVTCCLEGRIEIPIARQRIRIMYPRIQLTSQSQQWGYCYNLVTVCKHACIMATNRPTIDSQGYKSREGLIITAVWNMNPSRAVRYGRSSGVVCASLGQMKNQKRLLIHVM
jgi:hypothetical protein